MELRLGYKRTAVGVIPEEWSCTNVHGIASSTRNAIVGGPFGSELVTADYVEAGVPVIRGQNLSGKWVAGPFAFISERKARSLEANQARPGDIVFTQRGTLGQVSLVPGETYHSYVVSQSQMKVSVDPEIADPLFYYYVFTSERQQRLIVGATIQTGVPHINLGILRGIPVQRPPIDEQRAIARTLGDIDALVATLDCLITKKRDVKQAAKQQLLTGQTRLPGFTGQWQVTALGELGSWKGGLTPSMSNPAFWEMGVIPWVSSGDIKVSVLDNTSSVISVRAVKETSLVVLPVGSILIVTRSGILRKFLPVSRTGVPVTINQDIKALVVRRGIASEYIQHAITFHGPDILASCLKAGTTVESIEFPWLKRYRIELPKYEEQCAIAAVLSDMDTELASLEARRNKAGLLKQAMMQELLTGKTRLV